MRRSPSVVNRLTTTASLVLRHRFCSVLFAPPAHHFPASLRLGASPWGLLRSSPPGGSLPIRDFFLLYVVHVTGTWPRSPGQTSSPRRCRTLPGASSRRSWTGPTTVTPTPCLCQFCENAVLLCFRSSCAIFVFRLKFFLSPSSSMVTRCFLP